MVKGKKTSGYRGVRKREWGTWVTEIREPQIGKRIWLGSFATPEMAARAHDVASYTLKGDKALLNFPQNIDKYPRPRSTSPHDIRAAAAEAAAMNVNNMDENDDQGSSNKVDNGDDFWNEIDLPELVDLF